MGVVPMQSGPELTDRDLSTIRRLVYEQSGIALHAGKAALITARLQKRLRAGGFRTFKEYIRYVQADTSGDELTAMVDAIATNHTAFFREPQHFTFLRDVVLPSLLAARRGGTINGWCAACATGEEAYTMGMTVVDLLGDEASHRVRLLASDISTKALAVARTAAYKAQRIEEVPRDLVRKYFRPDPALPAGSMRVVDRVRQLIDFRRVNLLDSVGPGRAFDFIFCRNVMIYFDRDAQQRVVDGLERHLAPGGYLFISHSESLTGVSHGLTWLVPAVYRRGVR